MFSVVANWKMNLTNSQAREYLEQFFTRPIPSSNLELIIAPPFTLLPYLASFHQQKNFKIAAQNVYWQDQGAFTGEISPLMLRDLSCSHVMVGHSERRQYFSESNEQVAAKARAVLSADMIPIVCIGEDLQAYKEHKTQKVLLSQLSLVKELNPVWIAYEPVWSIGSGQIPSSHEINEAISTIKKELPQCRVLYGGSVNLQNLTELITVDQNDGFLVGGLSLKPLEFSSFLHQLAAT
jgi:triosephosphate isomerase (TIM)